MRRVAMFVGCALLGSLAARAPAEKATSAEVLDLLEASLAAGEGIPARVLLQRYLEDYPRTSRVIELEVLAEFYAGDYEAAANGIAELRKDPRSVTNLGDLADVIVSTYETTKNYETFTHENFQVSYAPGQDEILVPYAVDTLKAATEALEAELGVKMVSPVRLEIYPDAESLARVSPLSVEAIRTTGTIALCKWGRLMIASPSALMHGYPWLDTIAHEYVHLLLTKASLDQAPVWLQEGLAKFLETRWRRDEPSLRDDPASSQLLHAAAEANELLDFDQLHPSIALLPTQEAASLAFAQVSSFMEAYYGEYGREGVQQAIRRVGQGEDARKAFARGRWHPLEEPRGTLEARAVEETGIAPGEVDAALPQRRGDRARRACRCGARARAQLRAAGRPLVGLVLGQRPRQWNTRRRHDAAPGDPVVASRYARSAIAGGRPHVAIAPLRQTLEGYPTHAPALSSLATALFRTERFGDARDAANRAIAHNPFDPQPHCILSKLPVPQADHEETVCSRLGGMRE